MNPVVSLALRNRVSAVGVALTTASALLFILLFVFEELGLFRNPYAGLVVFVLVPALFVLGLLLVLAGTWLDRRRRQQAPAAEWPTLDFSHPTTRRMTGFIAIATLVNLVIVALASYGAVEYTESRSFCGQACHEPMEPEFVAHQTGLHARVDCVSCHVGPGAGGFLRAKLNGTRQLWHVMTGNVPRPIPTPIEGLPAVEDTCETCHEPDRFVGDKAKVFYEYADDEANTETKTTVRLHVGGPVSGTGSGTGIHWHMNRANRVEYIATDDKLETIPYVRVTTPDGNVREYVAEGAAPAEFEGKPRRTMSCLDCHTRPAHTFSPSAERAVDAAIGAGQISAKIPFVRREAVRALAAAYPSHEVALPEIERTMREALKPANADPAELTKAIGVAQALYRTNVFPSMKVGWGTYKAHLGHNVAPGCFRCHDETHKTRDGVALSQDCEKCHSFE